MVVQRIRNCKQKSLKHKRLSELARLWKLVSSAQASLAELTWLKVSVEIVAQLAVIFLKEMRNSSSKDKK